MKEKYETYKRQYNNYIILFKQGNFYLSMNDDAIVLNNLFHYKIKAVTNFIKTGKIIIIDSYTDNTLLDIVKRLNIEVIVITKKDNLLTHQDITKYNKQYHNLRVIFNNSFHDRYFSIDGKDVYHCGASINRIGYKTFSINLISDEEVCNLLINKVNKIL